MIKTEKMDLMAQCICDILEVDKEEFYGVSRYADLVEARRYFCYFSREIFGYNLHTIANHIGKNHATVIHHHKKLKQEVELYQDVRDNVSVLRDKLIRIFSSRAFKRQIKESAGKIRFYDSMIKKEKDFIKSL